MLEPGSEEAPRGQPQTVSKPKQLLVEGRDAEVFFRAMIRSLGLTELEIRNFGGIGCQ